MTEWRRPERVEMPTGAIPFEEHVPRTVDELGLELDDRPRSRRLPYIIGAVVLVTIVAIALLLTRGEPTVVADLAPGDCFSPATGDLGAALDRKACDGAHGGQFVSLFPVPDQGDDTYPGAEELAVFGEATCADRAEDAAGTSVAALAAQGVTLRIAVPDEQEWSAGEHSVACSFASDGSEDLTEPVG
jgi:hypothetical protein